MLFNSNLKVYEEEREQNCLQLHPKKKVLMELAKEASQPQTEK